jgi:hypothetical protein
MDKDSAKFLLDMLNAQNINVGSPDFETLTMKVSKAKGQLLLIINQPEQREVTK